MTHVYQPHAGGFAYFTSGVINGAIGVGGTWTAYSTLTLPAYTLGGTVTSNGQSFSGTIANLGTVTTVDLNGGTIDGTIIGGAVPAAGTFTTAAATTGNITTVNATTVDATNIEVTNLKAKDGTAAGSIADATGVVTLASSVLTTTDINAGTIDGTTQASGTINGPIAAGGTWTAAAAWTLPAFTLGGTVTSNGQSFSGTIANLGTVTTADINGGTIDGTVIGGASAAAATFTDLTTTGNTTLGNASTDTLNVGNGGIIKDASGNVGVGVSPSYRLHIAGEGNVLMVDGFGIAAASPGTLFRKAEGSQASPSGVSANSFLGGFLCAGYTSSGAFSGNVGAFAIKAAEAFTASAQGTYATIETTATGATSRAERVRVDSAGNMGIGVSPSVRLHAEVSAAASTQIALFKNASTHADAASSVVVDSGGRYVTQTVKYSTQIAQITGNNITSMFSNFDTHYWRTNAFSTVATLNSTGLGIGVTPSYKLHVDAGANDAAGLFTGSNPQTKVYVENSATDGDPVFVARIPETRAWMFGIDDSDSDAFKIAPTEDTDWSDAVLVMETGAGTVTLKSDRMTFASGYHVSSATATGTTPAIQSGTYTPTGTGVSNVNTVDIIERQAQWLRVGNVVTVSGELSVSPSTAGVVVLRLSLPIASALTTAYQLSGSGAWHFTSGNVTAVGIQGDAANNEAKFTFGSGVNSQEILTYTYSYEVLA